jgi:hypothetical protein
MLAVVAALAKQFLLVRVALEAAVMALEVAQDKLEQPIEAVAVVLAAVLLLMLVATAVQVS